MPDSLTILADGSLIDWIVSSIAGLTPWLLVIAGFGFLIFVHELGHFLAAKWVGIRVDTFSVGFGTRLLGFKHRGTDYCIRLLPLGGYVKMHGQEDFVIDKSGEYEILDEDSFHAKTVGQRSVVVLAGPIMNVVFALFVFTVVFMVGRYVTPPIIGEAYEGMPAEEAGLKAGDRILEINGSKTETYRDVQIAVVLAPADEKMQITIVREGFDEPIELKPIDPKDNEDRGIRQIGVLPQSDIRIHQNLGFGDSPSGPSIQAEDELVEINGKPITAWHHFSNEIEGAKGGWCDVAVRRWPLTSDGKRVLESEPQLVSGIRMRAAFSFKRTFSELDADGSKIVDHVLGIVPRRRVALMMDEQYAPEAPVHEAGLKLGDVIVEFHGAENPTSSQIIETFDQNKNLEVGMVVERGGERVALTMTPESKIGREHAYTGLIGLAPDASLVVAADVLPDSPAEKAGLVPGSRIVQIDGKPVNDWYDLVDGLFAVAGSTVPVKFVVGEQENEGQFAIPKIDPAVEGGDWNSRIAYSAELAVTPWDRLVSMQTYNPFLAMWWGIKQTAQLVELQYRTMKAMLIDRVVSAKQVSGPIGIIRQGGQVAKLGLNSLMYFLGFISVALAVINLLPIPIMDGGLLVFLIIEKIKGRPVNFKIQVVTQLIGLVLIVGMFLIVTFWDIKRIFT
jgi:regulator of sigma E protease